MFRRKCNIKLNYSSLSDQQENLKSTPQALQNIYNGYALYDSTVGIIIFPDTPSTLFHEYHMDLMLTFLMRIEHVIVQQSFDTVRTQWETQFGYVPGFQNT